MNANIQKIVDKISAKVATYTNPESLGTSDLIEIIAIAVQDLYAQPDVFMSNNNVVEMDFSNYINVRRLYAQGNPFVTLDISPMVNLEHLELFSFDLIGLDLSANTLLKYLILNAQNFTTPQVDLSANTLLENLIITLPNGMTTFDISSNTQLVELSIDNNELSTIDLSNNGLLKTINLNGNSFGSSEIDTIISTVRTNAESNNITNGVLYVGGDFPPTPASDADKNYLISNLGWDVQHT